jgi:AraC-like DNA-binding protein
VSRGSCASGSRDQDRRAAVIALAREYAAGHVIASHFHDRDQLVYASHGVMTVRSRAGAWVVPPHRAVWVPAAVPHTVTMSGAVAMRTLYLRPRLAKALPRACCVLNVPPLLRELLLHACAATALSHRIAWQRHLIDVILDQFQTVQTVPLQLPTPSDPRALRAAELLLAAPDERRPLRQLCRAAGASERTLERLFQDDVGMTVGKWRQQARLLHALRLLAEGAKVTHAASEAGYSTPSAFIHMFRKTLGTTPMRYFTPGGRAARRATDRRSGRRRGHGETHQQL